MPPGWHMPAFSPEAIDAVSTLLMVGGFGTTFFAYKYSKSFVIGIGGLLFGLFLWNEVVPQFVNDMLVCYVVGCAVALVGAFVGGVVALLMRWASSGASIGTLTALWIVLVDSGTLITNETRVASVFGTCLAIGMAISWYKEEVCMLAAFAAFGGLIVSYGLDLLLEKSLLLDTGVVLQMQWPEHRHCDGNCFMPELLAVWLCLTLVGFVVQGQLSGIFSLTDMWQRCTGGHSYTPISPVRKTTEGTGKIACQRTFTYPDNQAYNYFNPDKLPPALQAHTDLIYRTADQLANFFGFQDDNVRNQVEHIMSLVANHRRFTETGPTLSSLSTTSNLSALTFNRTGVHSLHRKLFENYLGWCKNLNVAAKFMPILGGHNADESDEVGAKMVDIMLYLCIWGEAANLRHMPECLCFLYHKMMQEFLVHRGAGEGAALYAGYFLDHVVTPIWDVVLKHHKVKGDHIKARNYDDFNEFFWSPQCLRHSYRDVDDEVSDSPKGSIQHLDRLIQERELKKQNQYNQPLVTPVHKALAKAPKTFLEKRSLLSTILTFHRILEFHVVTFWILAVMSFAEMLVWDVSYTLQMVSSVFLIFNLLGICWCMLEVWQAFPGINITGTAKSGFLIRLATRFLILVYQALYFMWSLDGESDKIGMQVQGPPLFWWWQYIWLSSIAMSTYVIEALFQLVPPLTTYICTRENDYLNALLNICFPLSRQYVGKNVDESFRNAAGYITYWFTLLAWKLYFSYQYEVKILVLPTVELFDDYINFPDPSFWRTATLIILTWIPQILIYLIDTSIWFACWSAMAGSVVGFQEKLGEIRDFRGIRGAFMKIPQEFCSKIISAGASSRDNSLVDLKNAGTTSSNNVSRVNTSIPINNSGMNISTPIEKNNGNDDSNNTTVNEATALLGNKTSDRNGSGSVQQYVAEFLDVRTQKWAAFAAVWNEVINQMRLSDVLSNAERDMLKFHSFKMMNTRKPVYLPIFQTAGCVERAVAVMVQEATTYNYEESSNDYNDTNSSTSSTSSIARKASYEKSLQSRINADITVGEAVSEVWELGIYLLRTLLGPLHEGDINRFETIISEFITSKEVMKHLRLEKLTAIISDATAIITILHTSLARRVPRVTKDTIDSTMPASSPDTIRTNTFSFLNRPSSGLNGMKRAVSTSGLSNMTAPFPTGDDNKETSPKEPSTATSTSTSTSTSTFSALTPRNHGANMIPRSIAVERSSMVPDKTRDQVRDKLRPLVHSIRSMIKPSSNGDTRCGEIQDLLSLILKLEQGFMWDDGYATSRLDKLAQDETDTAVVSKLYGLLAVQVNDAEPQSPEARRRLSFFVNSLFMNMPRAPPVSSMMSWSCMTPYYSEDVLYGRRDLEMRNEDGLSTLMYLQALYKHDWRNFIERQGITDEQQIWSKRFFQQTRLWASLRAQTLARTVEGMMYYEAALRLLAHGENYTTEQAENVIKQKFQYVIACQVYGRMKKNQDPKADDIDRLLKRFPNLRVAYIDEVRVTREGQNEYSSVLIKASEVDHTIEEVYRVKLPGNPVIGEGKPENQNHAIIFTRGENVQAIDMNQEGYFEEALKHRCVLQEFVDENHPNTTIVGFREHIFTGSVSSLANYMALQELSFVTLGQRVLNTPLRIRMHYGHPDLFDKVFFMTRGGISKASKGINLSEDIFAGYNNCIRGGKVQFAEYVQVGKGRDVGMQQIYKFEAKLAQGAAEQSLSRDTNRLGTRLDFFRLISFYFGGLGYYIGNFITVATIVFVVYFMLALAVFQAEKIGERKITPEGTLQMLLAGMGILNTLPMLATIMVEKGLRASLMTVGQVFVSGGPMYFMFHIQTRAHYFYQTLLAGGAQYRATGRGFVTHHSTFDDLYRFFATSHFYLGFELVIALIIMAFMTAAKQYFGRTWSLWLACISFLFAPFWFNPLSFEWNKVVDDYKRWMRWMTGVGGSSSNSWEVWWREENGYLSKFGLGQKLQCMIKPVFYLIIGVGIALPKIVEMQGMKPKDVKSFIHISIAAFLLMLAYYIVDKFGQNFQPWIRRSGKLLLSSSMFIGGVILVIKHYEYIKIAVGFYYITAALSTTCVLLGYHGMRHAYHMHDFILGHILFFVLILMAALQFPKDVQTWLLFHNALSQGVVIEDILKYARKSQEQSAGSEDALLEDASELKKVLAQQKLILAQMIEEGRISKMNGTHTDSNNSNSDSTSSNYSNTNLSQSFTVPLSFQDGTDTDNSTVETASMMKASRSTLDFSQMAHTSTRRQQANAANAANAANDNDAFQFRTPSEFPPRDQ